MTNIFINLAFPAFVNNFVMAAGVWNGLAEGSHTVYFKGWSAGSSAINDGSSPNWQFKKNTLPPQILINSDNGTAYNSAPLMDVDFSDACGLDDAYYKVDSNSPGPRVL